MSKKSLTERDICSKYISPALVSAGWDLHTQIREEVSFTQGRIIVRGRLHTRGESRRADYILYHQPNLPLAQAKALTGKGQPIVILMKTDMGYGVDFMMGSHHWHGVAPNDEQKEKALAQLEETLGDY